MTDTARLPEPLIDNYAWQADAACRGMDPAVFFPPTSEGGVRHRQRLDAAKMICRRCPAIQACLSHALRAREASGVWGGLSESERAEILGLRSLRYPAAAPDRT